MDVPADATPGLTPVTAGALFCAVTVNGLELVAVPAALATPIGPLDASAGTITTSCAGDADATTAGAPLKVTAFAPGSALNAVPVIATVEPAAPPAGGTRESRLHPRFDVRSTGRCRRRRIGRRRRRRSNRQRDQPVQIVVRIRHSARRERERAHGTVPVRDVDNRWWRGSVTFRGHADRIRSGRKTRERGVP